jgi:hypothetical protein
VLLRFEQVCKSRILSRFLFSALLHVALYCAPGSVRVEPGTEWSFHRGAVAAVKFSATRVDQLSLSVSVITLANNESSTLCCNTNQRSLT